MQTKNAVLISTCAPVTHGHTRFIPRDEFATYTSCDDQTLSHLAKVAKIIAKAQEETF